MGKGTGNLRSVRRGTMIGWAVEHLSRRRERVCPVAREFDRRSLESMTVLSVCIAISAGFAVAERGIRAWLFAVSAFAAMAGLLLLLVADLERAVLFAALLAMAISGASSVKFHHSGLKLTLADLSLLFAGTVPFLVAQYRQAAVVVMSAGIALLAAGVAIWQWRGGPALPWGTRGLVALTALLTCTVVYRVLGGRGAFQAGGGGSGAHFSTFAASVIDVASWWRTPGLRLSDMSSVPLPLSAAVPARQDQRPDLLVIQHESIFDPRLYGLPVGEEVASFLSPAGGLSGALNVDIYGGGSWQSEFSLLTGLSSASFGPDAYFIFQKGVGRFHHTLPQALKEQGYRTTLLSSCRRSFLHYDAFYGSIGFDERLFSDDLPAPFDVTAFEATNSDTMFFKVVEQALGERMAHDEVPRFTYLLTNFNHGPHSRRLAGADRYPAAEALAREGRAEEPQYVEYYARLSETAAAWRDLKDGLKQRFPGRPMLVVHYGDHQPVMTRRIERHVPSDASDLRRPFRTFYALEGINFEIDRTAVPQAAILDIAFLGTVAMQAAGLPLDPASATRASLMAECGSAYFSAPSEKKRRFHRTLVDMGLIDIGPERRAGPRRRD